MILVMPWIMKLNLTCGSYISVNIFVYIFVAHPSADIEKLQVAMVSYISLIPDQHDGMYISWLTHRLTELHRSNHKLVEIFYSLRNLLWYRGSFYMWIWRKAIEEKCRFSFKFLSSRKSLCVMQVGNACQRAIVHPVSMAQTHANDGQ